MGQQLFLLVAGCCLLHQGGVDLNPGISPTVHHLQDQSPGDQNWWEVVDLLWVHCFPDRVFCGAFHGGFLTSGISSGQDILLRTFSQWIHSCGS